MNEEAETEAGEAALGAEAGRGAMTASLAPAQQPSVEATESIGETERDEGRCVSNIFYPSTNVHMRATHQKPFL